MGLLDSPCATRLFLLPFCTPATARPPADATIALHDWVLIRRFLRAGLCTRLASPLAPCQLLSTSLNSLHLHSCRCHWAFFFGTRPRLGLMPCHCLHHLLALFLQLGAPTCVVSVAASCQNEGLSRLQHGAKACNSKHTSMHRLKSVDEDLRDTLFKVIVGRMKVPPGVAQDSCQLLVLGSKFLFCLLAQGYLSRVEFRSSEHCARRGGTAPDVSNCKGESLVLQGLNPCNTWVISCITPLNFQYM